MVLTRHAAPVIDGLTNTLGIHTSTPTASGKRSARLNAIILVLLISAVILKVALIYPDKINVDAFKAYLPLGAVEYMNSNQPEGRLFNPYNWGGYLLWGLPGYPVFVDGRTDLYDDEIINKWLTVARVEDGWQDILDEYGVNLVLIEPRSMLDRTLAVDPAWSPIYEDAISILYQRK